MGVFSIEMDLENYIDDILDKHLQQKEQVKFEKKLNKAMENVIVYGVPGESFQGIRFKSPLADLMKTEKGVMLIKDTIANDIIKELKDKNILLNTNIPENLLKEAGLKEGQYVRPSSAISVSIDYGKKAENSIKR